MGTPKGTRPASGAMKALAPARLLSNSCGDALCSTSATLIESERGGRGGRGAREKEREREREREREALQVSRIRSSFVSSLYALTNAKQWTKTNACAQRERERARALRGTLQNHTWTDSTALTSKPSPPPHTHAHTHMEVQPISRILTALESPSTPTPTSSTIP